jgi:ADP-ribosylglycohydrolase
MRDVDAFQDITGEDRLRGAVWGQFVGDAAALGTHWIYDLDELQQVYPHGIRGFEAPKEGHYHFGKKSGDQTHYGDGALVLLESLAKEGRFSAKNFGRSLVEAFRPNVYSGYIDRATRDTLENLQAFTASNPSEAYDFQQGADDDQLATASRLAALTVRYRDDPSLLTAVEQATRVCQNKDETVAYMKFNALFLLEFFHGRDINTALRRAEEQTVAVEPRFAEEIHHKIREAQKETVNDVIEATLALGQACPLPQSFPSAIQALLRHPDDFESAILATLRAGATTLDELRCSAPGSERTLGSLRFQKIGRTN